NVGYYNRVRPELLMIPRRPTNLFYDVTTPDLWTNEYNYLYRSQFGRDLSTEEVEEQETEILVSYLLKGENDPWMFHQANLSAYDGQHSTLTDLLDRILDRFEGLSTLPIMSPSMEELGERVAARTGYYAANVTAQLEP